MRKGSEHGNSRGMGQTSQKVKMVKHPGNGILTAKVNHEVALTGIGCR